MAIPAQANLGQYIIYTPPACPPSCTLAPRGPGSRLRLPRAHLPACSLHAAAALGGGRRSQNRDLGGHAPASLATIVTNPRAFLVVLHCEETLIIFSFALNAPFNKSKLAPGLAVLGQRPQCPRSLPRRRLSRVALPPPPCCRPRSALLTGLSRLSVSEKAPHS